MSAAPYAKPMGRLGIWPLMVLMLASLAYPLIEPPATNTLQGAEESGWSRLVFFTASYVLAGMLVLPRAGRVFALAKRMWAYWLLLVLVLASSFWSSYPEKVAVNTVHYIGVFLVTACAVLYAQEREGGVLAPASLLCLVVVLASVLVVVVHPAMGIEPSGNIWEPNANRWRGITDHANTLGATASTVICGAIALFLTPRRLIVRLMAVATAGFCGAVLIFGCKSMTSAVGTVAFAGVYLLMTSLRGSSPAMRRIKLVGFALLGVAGLSVLFMVRPELDLTDLFFKVTGRSKTLTGRTMLWQMAFKLIDLKPWLGWGFDSIASARKFLSGSMGYGQFHNGYLQIAVQGGFVGLGLLLTMLLRNLRSGLAVIGLDFVAASMALSWLALVFVVDMAEAIYFMEGSPTWFLFMAAWMEMENRRLLGPKGPAEEPA